jgi:hypothetical protein
MPLAWRVSPGARPQRMQASGRVRAHWGWARIPAAAYGPGVGLGGNGERLGTVGLVGLGATSGEQAVAGVVSGGDEVGLAAMSQPVLGGLASIKRVAAQRLVRRIAPSPLLHDVEHLLHRRLGGARCSHGVGCLAAAPPRADITRKGLVSQTSLTGNPGTALRYARSSTGRPRSRAEWHSARLASAMRSSQVLQFSKWAGT